MEGENVVKRGRGRPPLSDAERMTTAQFYMRPGDLERIRAAAQRRKVPTGIEIRDMLLVLLEEPGAMTRATLAAIRVDLGFDQVVDAESSRPVRPRGPAPARDEPESAGGLVGAS